MLKNSLISPHVPHHVLGHVPVQVLSFVAQCFSKWLLRFSPQTLHASLICSVFLQWNITSTWSLIWRLVYDTLFHTWPLKAKHYSLCSVTSFTFCTVFFKCLSKELKCPNLNVIMLAILLIKDKKNLKTRKARNST